MYNIHIRIYTYVCGTGSGRKLKADINHVLRSAVHSVSLLLDSCQSAVYHLFFEFGFGYAWIAHEKGNNRPFF